MRATAVLTHTHDPVADTVTLDHQARHRRRMAMTADGGLAFLLDLERATVLHDGDALRLEDGRLVRVRAAPERLIEIRTPGDPLRLMTVAWHLGNRHVPTEITADALYIVEDHVLADMVRGLGAAAAAVERPFRPQRGAYDQPGGHHHHDHDDDHDHDHDHGHDHGHHHHG